MIESSLRLKRAHRHGFLRRPATRYLSRESRCIGSDALAARSAIDLPQKALIREDADGKTRISCNDPMFLQRRHNTQGCDAVLQKFATALAKFASKAGAAE